MNRAAQLTLVSTADLTSTRKPDLAGGHGEVFTHGQSQADSVVGNPSCIRLEDMPTAVSDAYRAVCSTMQERVVFVRMCYHSSVSRNRPFTDRQPNTLLKSKIIHSLEKQGFEIKDGLIIPPNLKDKCKLRALHGEAVKHNIAKGRSGLERHENQLLSYIASGNQVVPENINPHLVLVRRGSTDELLFRYARLHWSIPVSSGYGRRLRFLVYDKFNHKLIGIIGLGDPIFGLKPRDHWIGWEQKTKKERLQNIMELFVLGAVPPYSYLLCGKLIALLATSFEVQNEFYKKYKGQRSAISRRVLNGKLALLTTTSALGRSSIYNRLTYQKVRAFESVGFTSGSGDFHFANGFYEDLRELATNNCVKTAKHSAWGNGFRNRREVIQKTLPLLGLSTELLNHGIQREIFVAPLAANSTEFLRGDSPKLLSHKHTVDQLFEWFRSRWLLPRASRDTQYKEFDSNTYRLWTRS